MELSEQTIVKLIQEQSATTQAVTDLKSTLEKTIPYLVAQDQQNAADIRKVQKSQWYFGGAGTFLGFFIEHFGFKGIVQLFGGK